MRDYHCHKSYNNLSINIYKRQSVRAQIEKGMRMTERAGAEGGHDE